jgi:two-component system CheB/CheR fusion protein
MKKINTSPPAKTSWNRSFPVVGIGASAGGLEAVSSLLHQIPDKVGMAFVVIVHLEPFHKSQLSALLARSTSLKVQEARHGTVLEPNRVYVIPPNKYMSVKGGRLRLAKRPSDQSPPMPIDFFFRALSEEYGSQAMGVVLSGLGTDGTIGLGTIKSGGGITFAQSSDTAKFAAMPQSAVSSGYTDFSMAPSAIGLELVGRFRHRKADPLSGGGLLRAEGEISSAQNQIFFQLRRATGVDFSRYKQSTVNRRIARRILVTRSENLEKYAALLKNQPGEVELLFRDLLISVTRFFREPDSLDLIRKKAFPALMRLRPRGSALRVWIPGCSSGEEVYSLAILLKEFLGERIADYPVQIFGTDINENAIAKARAGHYQAHSLADVPPRLFKRYFAPENGGYRVDPGIRDLCIFARQDITSDPPFSQLDMISCQNMLIYFGPDLQKKVFRIFHYALKSGGFLALSSAETPGEHSHLFTQVSPSQKLYRKTNSSTESASSLTSQHPPNLPRPTPKPLRTRENLSLAIERAADQILLEHYSPSGVVIDEHLHVIQFRGQTLPFLKHLQDDAALHLLKLVDRQICGPLRSLLDRAFRENEPIRKTLFWTPPSAEPLRLDIRVVPFRIPPSRSIYGLVVFETSAASSARAPKEGGVPPSARKRTSTASSELRLLSDELTSTRATLQGIIEDHEATNEELQSANEEIQSANEELQSTNEELETSKEELQSTNEELRTVNDELSQSNLLANRINNDLLNLLASVQIPVVMVDGSLSVRRFTPSAQKFFNLIPTDVGRSICDIRNQLQMDNLEEMIREVISTLHLKECEVQDRAGHWFSLRIRPYRTHDNVIDGAVLALIDIHDLKNEIRRQSSKT